MSYNPFSLEGKTILVTGASSGIGKTTAIECSKMGAKLVVCGRNDRRLDETFSLLEGVKHTKFIGDLTNNDIISKLVNSVDVLNGIVLCAGQAITLPFPFCTREKFDDIFNINFFSQVELLRLLIKKKKIAKESSVVFVASIGGVYDFTITNTIYGASKAAINSTMKYCANELASKKIRVNSVNPGMVYTPLINNETYTEEQVKADISSYPLGRYGNPEDIANGIVYLLSDAASWVTGHALVIDGGKTI